MADWFDSELWKYSGSSKYNDPLAPGELLQSAPEAIWPGLMPPDFLPLISNGSGDWLGVRVDDDNNASEIVQWYHGGGDWIPWGRTLAEAVLFDLVSDRLPGPQRGHAIPAEPARDADPDRDVPATSNDRWMNWVCDHLPNDVTRLTSPDVSSQEIVDTLLDTGVAGTAVHCELIQSALHETLSAKLDPQAAQQLGIDWDTALEWMFDVQRIPESMSAKLATELGYRGDDVQDWVAVADHANRVTQISPDLSWGWDLLGYAFERQGETASAIDAYTTASKLSVFTDQSVRLRTHWSSRDAAKFSVSRMKRLCPELIESLKYLQLMDDSDTERRRENVSRHWLNLAEHSVSNRDYRGAHTHYVAAGWDLGAEPMPLYGQILQFASDMAEQSGQHARAYVAATHRECLRERYDL